MQVVLLINCVKELLSQGEDAHVPVYYWIGLIEQSCLWVLLIECAWFSKVLNKIKKNPLKWISFFCPLVKILSVVAAAQLIVLPPVQGLGDSSSFTGSFMWLVPPAVHYTGSHLDNTLGSEGHYVTDWFMNMAFESFPSIQVAHFLRYKRVNHRDSRLTSYFKIK